MQRQEKILIRLALGVACSLMVIGCNSPIATSLPDDDLISHNVYENKYFSFSLPLPDGWHVADNKTEEYIRQTSKQAIVENAPTLETALKEVEKTTYQLLILSQYPIGSSGNTNPYLIVGAEKVSQVPGIKSGEDYLSQATKLLLQQFPYEPLGEIYEYELDGKPFYRIDMVLDSQAGRIYQSYISMVSREYVLTFILTAQTEEEISRLEDIVKSGDFESISTDVVTSGKTASSTQGIIGLLLLMSGALVAIIQKWRQRRKADGKDAEA
jgi:hypothetical protein